MKKSGYLIEAYPYPQQKFFKDASYSGWSFTTNPEEADYFDTKEEADDIIGCINRGISVTYWDYDDILPKPVARPYQKNEK